MFFYVWLYYEKYERKLDIIKNLSILKLFNLYIKKIKNKLNKFELEYKIIY